MKFYFWVFRSNYRKKEIMAICWLYETVYDTILFKINPEKTPVNLRHFFDNIFFYCHLLDGNRPDGTDNGANKHTDHLTVIRSTLRHRKTQVT